MTVKNKNKSNSLLYDISIRIKNLRMKKNLTQERLGKLVGVNKSTIWGYENDISFPSLEVLVELASVFEVSADELLGLAPTNDNLIQQDLLSVSGLNSEQKQLIADLIEQLKKA